LCSSNHPEWEENLLLIMKEIHRVLRPNGTIIILETLGTGNEEPTPPDFLINYYETLRDQYKFNHQTIRTDYQFDSVQQAEELCREFFGDLLDDRIIKEQSSIVPECTGIWWVKYRE
jgi:hypothetical protein